MSAPLVVNTRDGACWTRRTVTEGGIALYAPEAVKTCPEFVMETLDDLATHGIVGSTDALPMPVGPEPQAPRLVALTEEQIEKLTAAGNRAVNDLIHDDLCACDAWPERCLSSGGFFQGYWDWGYLETAVRAVLGVWELMRVGDRVTQLEAALYTEQAHGRTFLEQRNAHAKELLKLRARVAELEAQRDRRRARLVALQNDALGMRGSLAPADGERKVPFELGETLTPAVEWLIARVAELEATQGTVYRASHDSIVMGLYTTPAAARAHCEDEERRFWPTGTALSFDWIEDEEDGVAELVVTAGQNEESTTGYVVEALEAAAEYDPDADE